jgi:H+/Cl- antiporter ClcA
LFGELERETCRRSKRHARKSRKRVDHQKVWLLTVIHGVLFAVAAVVFSWAIALNDPPLRSTASRPIRHCVLFGLVVVLMALAFLQVTGAFNHLGR